MKAFNYQARDNKTGKIIKSTVKAENEIAAGRLLLEQDLVPIHISEADNAGFLGVLPPRFV